MKKVQLKPHAVQLLREVKKQIRKAPTSFDISVIIEKARSLVYNKATANYADYITASVTLDHELLPPCKTTACIAGHVLIKSGETDVDHPLQRAAEILGLTPYEGHSLFLSGAWPKYATRDRQLRTKLQRLSHQRSNIHVDGKSTRVINRDIKRVITERGQLAIKRIDLLIDKGI